MFPKFRENDGGWLDWDNYIMSLASAIKCCWKLTTVSPNYLQEIRELDTPIRSLYNDEAGKSVGILNGIDSEQWNPRTDEALFYRYKKGWKTFKSKNQEEFCKTFDLVPGLPIVGFIGRLAHQKGADLMPDAIRQVMAKTRNVNFVILGTGDKKLEQQLKEIDGSFGGRVKVMLTYNESIARNIYASSDFLLMPSRFEPCGLNQLFAMRYGSVPIVRITGGLKDTVVDIGDDGGGITFYEETASELANAIHRGLDLYSQTKWFEKVRRDNGKKDYSWKKSMKAYADIYKELLNN
ncbi:glycosyltransferase [Chitinophagales bacterium]|nr:glycosyltransferase [Chitinophagales bacterium]